MLHEQQNIFFFFSCMWTLKELHATSNCTFPAHSTNKRISTLFVACILYGYVCVHDLGFAIWRWLKKRSHINGIFESFQKNKKKTQHLGSFFFFFGVYHWMKCSYLYLYFFWKYWNIPNDIWEREDEYHKK